MINGAPYGGLTWMVQFRIHDAGGGVPGAWTQQFYDNPTIVGARIEVATGAVPVGTTLDVQAASVGSTTALSNLSTIVEVSTALTAVGPGAPTLFNAGATGGGGISFTLTTPASALFASIQFYRGPVGGGFAGASPIFGRQYYPTNTAISYSNTSSTGSYDWFAVAQTQAGVASSPAGPATATIT